MRLERKKDKKDGGLGKREKILRGHMGGEGGFLTYLSQQYFETMTVNK
jgi:hypothetical protein